MAVGERVKDPYPNFNFLLEINGQILGSFSEASGLVADGDSIDYREGSDTSNSVRKLIGLRKYSNIVLKRGYTQNKDLWAWYRNIANGVHDRRNGTITLLDEARNPVLSWNFRNAWPNKIEAPTFKASGNEVAMESVEFCHEGLDIEV